MHLKFPQDLSKQPTDEQICGLVANKQCQYQANDIFKTLQKIIRYDS